MSNIPAVPNSPKGSPAATRIPVLEYHDSEYQMAKLLRMRTEWFLSQLQWLKDNGFYTLTGKEITQFVYGESQPIERSCALRIDIGLTIFRNLEEVILPALQKHSFHGLFFVRTSMIRDTNIDNYVSWDKLREWEQTGLVEVGSHSVNHPKFKNITPAWRKQEVQKSREIIESNLGHPITLFAYPYDSVPDRPKSLFQPLGYKLAFCGGIRAERSILFKDPTPYALPCYYPYSTDKIYPKIYATKGLTFEKMILSAIAPKTNKPK